MSKLRALPDILTFYPGQNLPTGVDLRRRRKNFQTQVASALSDFPSSKRRAYEQLIGLIYECSASQSNAKLLVDKILARIT